MFWPDVFMHQQHLDPLAGWIFWSPLWSTLFAALPVLVLFWLLVMRRWLAPKAGAMAATVALLIAVFIYHMRPDMAAMSFLHGAAFGLLPVGWTIFNAMLLYNVTVQTGKFDIVRRSVASLSGDARIQAILIAFSFGAFLEGAAGGGTPVAICGAIMVGLGFKPFLAAVLCLIANTSPVAYGGLGTPIFTLGNVTGIPNEAISIMAGRQLPFLSFLVPLYMVRCMCSWKQTWEVWPVLLVAGGSFAGFQFLFAHSSMYPMTDIAGGIFSLILTAVFLRFWKPKKDWHFDLTPEEVPTAENKLLDASDPHAAEAAALLAPPTSTQVHEPLTFKNVVIAWMPFAIMSVCLLLSGILRQEEGRRNSAKAEGVGFGPIRTNYVVSVPLLQDVKRDPRLHDKNRGEQQPEKAEYDIAWVTSPGSPVFAAAILSMLLLRMNFAQVRAVFVRTFYQMKIPIPTIAFMLGLSYVTRYSGMDATLGFAFAGTGLLYPFFAALLGWLGVFLTGTDAGSNALFGSLQKITATEIFNQFPAIFGNAGLGLDQAQLLICTANSTGGVMGKMIDAQSIVVATAATNQLGKEADIFKAVMWHSIILAVIVGFMTMLQAYVFPFSLMVPHQ